MFVCCWCHIFPDARSSAEPREPSLYLPHPPSSAGQRKRRRTSSRSTPMAAVEPPLRSPPITSPSPRRRASQSLVEGEYSVSATNYWSYWFVSKGAPRGKAGWKLIDFAARPEPQAEFCKRLPYGPIQSRRLQIHRREDRRQSGAETRRHQRDSTTSKSAGRSGLPLESSGASGAGPESPVRDLILFPARPHRCPAFEPVEMNRRKFHEGFPVARP